MSQDMSGKSGGKWGYDYNVESFDAKVIFSIFAFCQAVELDPSMTVHSVGPQSDSGRQSYAHFSETIRRAADASFAQNHALS